VHQRARAWLDDRFVPSIYPLPTSALESGASLSLIGEKAILCIDVLARTRVRVPGRPALAVLDSRCEVQRRTSSSTAHWFNIYCSW
jgi:hypothetical protein